MHIKYIVSIPDEQKQEIVRDHEINYEHVVPNLEVFDWAFDVLFQYSIDPDQVELN